MLQNQSSKRLKLLYAPSVTVMVGVFLLIISMIMAFLIHESANAQSRTEGQRTTGERIKRVQSSKQKKLNAFTALNLELRTVHTSRALLAIEIDTLNKTRANFNKESESLMRTYDAYITLLQSYVDNDSYDEKAVKRHKSSIYLQQRRVYNAYIEAQTVKESIQ